MSALNEKPEKRLTQLFLSMFSADELRRLLRYSFPDELVMNLPGANASPLALADAASEALLRRNDLDALWPRLIHERPRRQAEIEAVRDLIIQQLAGKPGPASGLGSTRGPVNAGPIRILFVLSCPPGQYQIDTAEEIRQIRAELQSAQYRDRFTHELITAATYTTCGRRCACTNRTSSTSPATAPPRPSSCSPTGAATRSASTP
jgi:hypothetical protein